MPETTDFESIARASVKSWNLDDGPIQRGLMIEDLAQQLRLVWNARGAADIATLNTAITYALSGTESGLVKHLDQAIRQLDR